jgi:hypothetical protein
MSNSSEPSTAGYAITYVHNSGNPGANAGNLQNAINSATCGTVIRLDSGAVYSGNLTLPPLSCGAGQWLIIETDPAHYSGPPEPAIQTAATLATRQSSATEPGLAVITTPNTSSAISTAASCTNGQVNITGNAVTWLSGNGYSAQFTTGSAWNGQTILIGETPPVPYTVQSVNSATALTLTASAGTQTNVQYGVCLGTPVNHYWFRNLEISSTSTTGTPPFTYSIVQIGGGNPYQDSQRDFIPHDVVFDRLYIHADASREVNKGIVLNAANSAVINCDIREIHGFASFTDSNAIGETNAPGPLLVDNNYLDADGENILWGGAAPAVPNLFPTDITITRNHFIKPFTRYSQYPGYDGQKHIVKNLMEFKHGQRIVIEGNLIEGVWANAQYGGALTFFGTDDYPTGGPNGNMPCTACAVQNVTVRYNVVRHAAQAFAIGQINQAVVPWYNSFSIHDNLWDDIDAFWSASIADICGATESGTTVTLTMCVPLSTYGDIVTGVHATVLKVTPAGYNAPYLGATLTVPNPGGTTVTYTVSATGLGPAGAGGTLAVPVAQQGIQITSGSTATGPGTANHDLSIKHNTFVEWNVVSGLLIDLSGGPKFQNYVVSDNFFGAGNNFVAGTCSGIAANLVNPVFNNNAIAQMSAANVYLYQTSGCAWTPNLGKWFPSDWNSVGFTSAPGSTPNYPGGSVNGAHTLLPTSSFHLAGDDGTDVGANIGLIRAKLIDTW